MKKVTVTIHKRDDSIKHVEIDNESRNSLYIVLLFIFTVILSIIATIIYLSTTIETKNREKEHLEKEYNRMKHTNEFLTKRVVSIEQELFDKIDKLYKTSKDIRLLEETIGLKRKKGAPIEKRIETLKVSAKHKALIFRFIPNGSPVVYKGITSKYGYRLHPKLKKREFHRGSDLKAGMNTPVYATANGIVEFAGYHKRSGYGRMIIIYHNYGFRTYFAHLKKSVVKTGAYVEKGDLIGYTGNSGLSSGPHLHYEIRYLQHTVNPFWFIKWRFDNFDEIRQKIKPVPWKKLFGAIMRDYGIDNAK